MIAGRPMKNEPGEPRFPPLRHPVAPGHLLSVRRGHPRGLWRTKDNFGSFSDVMSLKLSSYPLFLLPDYQIHLKSWGRIRAFSMLSFHHFNYLRLNFPAFPSFSFCLRCFSWKISSCQEGCPRRHRERFLHDGESKKPINFNGWGARYNLAMSGVVKITWTEEQTFLAIIELSFHLITGFSLVQEGYSIIIISLEEGINKFCSPWKTWKVPIFFSFLESLDLGKCPSRHLLKNKRQIQRRNEKGVSTLHWRRHVVWQRIQSFFLLSLSYFKGLISSPVFL